MVYQGINTATFRFGILEMLHVILSIALSEWGGFFLQPVKSKYSLFLDYIIYLNPVIELQRCNNAKYRLNVKQCRILTLIGGGGGRLSRPLDKGGGGGGLPKIFFRPLPWLRHCEVILTQFQIARGYKCEGIVTFSPYIVEDPVSSLRSCSWLRPSVYAKAVNPLTEGASFFCLFNCSREERFESN